LLSAIAGRRVPPAKRQSEQVREFRTPEASDVPENLPCDVLSQGLPGGTRTMLVVHGHASPLLYGVALMIPYDDLWAPASRLSRHDLKDDMRRPDCQFVLAQGLVTSGRSAQLEGR